MMTVTFECDSLVNSLTSSDSLLTSSVMGVIYFPEHRFKLVNRLKSKQGAFKICRDRREDVKVALGVKPPGWSSNTQQFTRAK